MIILTLSAKYYRVSDSEYFKEIDRTNTDEKTYLKSHLKKLLMKIKMKALFCRIPELY